MKNIMNLSLRIFIILFATNSFPLISMWQTTIKRAHKKCMTAARVLTGQIPVYEIWKQEKFLSSESEYDTSSECEPFDFTNLPQDLRYDIIRLLIINDSAHDLTTAIQAIRALSLVSKDFYFLIKESTTDIVPVIRHLSDKFLISPYNVAQKLGNPYGMQFFKPR